MAEHNLGSMILLSATNYAIWKPRMEDILFCKDLHDPLENKGDKPVVMKDEEWRKMNRKMIGLIRQCIGHEVFHHVAQGTSAYELWIKLEEMYQAKTSQNKALLMRRLFDDEMQALLLLSSLLESWETLVVSLSNSAPNGKLTTSMVMDALFNEEARRREMGSTWVQCPLMRLRYLGCCLANLMGGAGSETVRMDKPSSELKGEIVESSLSG
ncbi:hypothetical protein Acr_15g0010140 [Actinidia rufa]|uniref:Uncharacterized protein n=1 Tax=Actinidia rufa TaxID=165716 RepID=A0A7J0FUM7_9ERIC|nr:hypothetical protein Acr_15g0010140 [Actinidia rufa]